MPTEDGYTLIRKVRRLPVELIRAIPAIALTAFNRPEDRLKSIQSGFQAHIGKPVSAIELTELIIQLTKHIPYQTEDGPRIC